ncbi:abortive infection family protein [Maribacter confluentis]|uniref:Abortive infection family protein n=1 Tax=Maribacter confluentis TaxID=1656093 RepID=A0ABT8RMZ7_9FLAO|nr:abortive infection family protein [Maribacter confluentis]MDO1512268.1 abortive infection family protein [Maribacter confluentis]
MKVTERTIKFLGKTLCGDNHILPYKTGQELVDFFVEFGADDQYGEGFPSRWRYTEDKVRQFNGTQELKLIIENSVDPRDLMEAGADLEKLDDIIKPINDYLRFDGFELKKVGDFFKVYDSKGIIVEPETVKGLNHEFIQEQITKCHYKIDQGDFNGAITNARSLAEAVMIEIIEQHEGKEIKNDGKLENLYKQVKKILNLTIDPKKFPQTIIQILSGLDSITGGLAGLSNNSGDRHANKFKTMKHHARLAVNSTMTLVDFLLDSKEYQKK